MPMWDLIDRNGTRLTGLRSEAHWGGKILNVFPLNRSDSLPDWRLGGNFFWCNKFPFWFWLKHMLADKPHLMHLRDSGSRGRVLSVQEPILEQLQADLCSHNLCLVNTHNIKHYTHKTIFTRLLECAHSFVEDYVSSPQFTHRPILPCVQTIQLPGSSALCKPLEKRPSLLLNTHWTFKIVQFGGNH